VATAEEVDLTGSNARDPFEGLVPGVARHEDAIVVIGGVLTQSRTAETFGFVRMPSPYFVFLAAVVGTYLLIVEIVKRRVIQRLMPGHLS
jgi:hypothetical protein